MFDTTQRLINILEKTKINHKTEILKCPDLKYAHIYCKINDLSGQFSGPLIENYIENKFGFLKINSNLCKGDLMSKRGINYEIKVSNGGKEHNKFNYVQLRLNHDCNYILTAYYLSRDNVKNNGELFTFKLDKENLRNIIYKYGGYAHGTIVKNGKITKEDLYCETNTKEYAIRPKYGDNCWNELCNYLIDNSLEDITKFE